MIPTGPVSFDGPMSEWGFNRLFTVLNVITTCSETCEKGEGCVTRIRVVRVSPKFEPVLSVGRGGIVRVISLPFLNRAAATGRAALASKTSSYVTMFRM